MEIVPNNKQQMSMTIAERLRMEKKAKVGFAPVEFMEIVENWFKNHEYDQWLTINTNCFCDKYLFSKKNINDCFWDSSKSTDSKRFWSIEYIGVPTIYLENYLDLLINEGFSIFRENEHAYKVSLNDVPFIHYGNNIWTRVK